MGKFLLEVKGVSKVFGGKVGDPRAVKALDNVSLTLPSDKAQITTIAGESGSGKTTLALAVLGLQPLSSGQILFNGDDIYSLKGEAFKEYRRNVQAIFQNPFEVFNPFYRIDHVFDLAIKNFGLADSKSEARRLMTEALEAVRLDPDLTLGRYAHQLSGGQLQRAMIARAIMLKPQIIVADEPVSMIDSSLRAIVLDIMARLKSEYGISQLYITHDLSTALQVSDEIMIMYRGSVVESGNAVSVIQSPKHSYTRLLVSCVPVPDRKWGSPLKLDVDTVAATMS